MKKILTNIMSKDRRNELIKTIIYAIISALAGFFTTSCARAATDKADTLTQDTELVAQVPGTLEQVPEMLAQIPQIVKSANHQMTL